MEILDGGLVEEVFFSDAVCGVAAIFEKGKWIDAPTDHWYHLNEILPHEMLLVNTHRYMHGNPCIMSIAKIGPLRYYMDVARGKWICAFSEGGCYEQKDL